MELHCFSDEYVVVAYGFDVDLRAGEECFYSEHVYYHAAFGATLDITFDDFLVVKGFVDALPCFHCTRLFVRKKKLAFLVFFAFDVNFNFVSYFEVGIVAEVADRNNAVRLVAYVYYCLALVDGNNCAFYDFVLVYLIERFVISLFLFFFACL